MKNSFVSVIVIVTAIAVALIVYYGFDKGKVNPSNIDNEIIANATQELKKFSSSQEIADFLKNIRNQQSDINSRYMVGTGGDMAITEAAPAALEKTDASSGSSAATDYSQTNVQVEGVDEADFVKNDNKHIYTISGNKLVILDAYPGTDAKIVSETTIEGNPRELFINNDKLIIFSDSYETTYAIPKYDYFPREQYTQKLHVLVYDVSDRAHPKAVKNYTIDGYYYQSRMIKDYVYVITTNPVYYYGDIVPLPGIAESGKMITRPDVYYFDNPEDSYVFHTIASFNVAGGDINAKSFMLGYSNTLYVSENAIYLAYQKNVPYYYQEKENENRFYEIVVPLLPGPVQAEINDVKSSDLSINEKWDKISVILENMYNKMSENEKQELQKKIQNAINEYEAKREAERRKTVIHKITISNGDINYDNRGEVNGYLLNQFSLDEYEGNLRVATTTYIYSGTSEMYNNVYILDNGLKVTGKVEDIAPDERIYSTRFIKDRLYMVTFKRVDPFFVIDLTPNNPKILGELKIPGFSDYLHPYDDNYIIGIGKETEGNEWGGVSLKGLKLALFDVRDVANPKQVGMYEIGTQGTDSEALQEHKAFLFDKKKGILVIPVREVRQRIYDDRRGYYMWDTWQGAYVFNVDTTNGFTLKGKISHGEQENDNYYYGSPYAVRRSLFMDDYLYTISGKMVKVNLLSDMSSIKEILLPFTQNNWVYGGGPVPMMTGETVAESGVAQAVAVMK